MIETDVVILGIGTAGEDLAIQLLDAGVDVVGIEPNLVGGECPYWACIPSKIAVRAANTLKEAERANELAGEVTVQPDWSKVAGRIRTEATSNWDDTYAAQRFEGKGGRLIRDYGRIIGPDTVEAGDQTVRARRAIVIATGSRPFVPDVPGLDRIEYWTTHDAIDAETLPETLLIVGGGAVSCELGQVLSRFGVGVTIVEGHRLLPHNEPEVSDLIRQVFESEGMTVITGAHVIAFENGDEKIVASLEDGTEVQTDAVLFASGRVTDVSRLGLENTDAVTDGRTVSVDGLLRAAPGLYAIGDITGQAMLTQIGLYQSTIVAADLLDGNPAPADYSTMPQATFTDPEVGAVGLTEDAAREQGLNVRVAMKQLPATLRGWLHSHGNTGFIKLVVDGDRDVIVGATTVGPSGGEILGLLALAIREQTPLSRLRSMIYPFPTFYGAIGEAIGAYGRGTGTVVDPDYMSSGIVD